jgi:hypothetical protein
MILPALSGRPTSDNPATTLGSPLVSSGVAGCQVAGNPSQRTGESSARRPMVLLKKGPVIGDGSQSREDPQLGRTPKVSRFPAALCVAIHTPAENQLHPHSEHSCARRHSHDSGKLFGD